MKKNNSRRWLGIVLCIALVLSTFALAGCDDKDMPDQPDPGDVTKERAVKLYFASAEYINTGVETDTVKMMMPAYEFKLLVEADDVDDTQDVYQDALDALQFTPTEEYTTILSDKLDVDDVVVKDGTAYVDMDKEYLMGGTLEETILINQIVCTLVDSFTEIEKVQFLVEGQNVNTLMGQMDTSRPFTMGENGIAVVTE